MEVLKRVTADDIVSTILEQQGEIPLNELTKILEGAGFSRAYAYKRLRILHQSDRIQKIQDGSIVWVKR